MFNKRIGLRELEGDESKTIINYCEDAIFTKNAMSKFWAQGSATFILADLITCDNLIAYWNARLLQVKDDNPVLWGLTLNEADYWIRRFLSLDKNMRGEV